jgi:hypothetical protein
VGGLRRALLRVLTLGSLVATGEPTSAFEGPGLEFGLLLGWQSFQQQGYFDWTTFPGAMGASRMASGLG